MTRTGFRGLGGSKGQSGVQRCRLFQGVLGFRVSVLGFRV